MERIKVPDLDTLLAERKQVVRRVPTPLHEFVSRARYELKETSTTGDGSYGFYLGVLKTIPIPTLYLLLGAAKDANDPLKSFWWSVGDYKRKQKESRNGKKEKEDLGTTKGDTMSEV